jgi:hypothetical protein
VRAAAALDDPAVLGDLIRPVHGEVEPGRRVRTLEADHLEPEGAGVLLGGE